MPFCLQRALLVAAALVGVLVIGAAADDVHASRVSELVQQLDADRLQQRVDAERSLQQLGPAALPHLPDPLTLHPSSADAVRRVRIHLERQQARDVLKPSRVALSGTFTLGEIIDTIVSQTGNTIDTADLPQTTRDQQHVVDFKDEPFWSVIGKLQGQSDILIHAEDGSEQLTAKVRDQDRGDAAIQTIVGPFRMTVVSAALRPDFINPERRLLRITFDVETEPRLRPLFAYIADADLAVTGASAKKNGESPQAFPSLSPDASREIPVGGSNRVRFTHDVILPPEKAQDRIDSIKLNGSIELELAAGRETFEFRHLDEPGPVSRRHGGVRVTLDKVEPAGDDLRASLNIAYDTGGPKFESHRAWVFHNDVSLTNGSGNSIRPTEQETLHESNAGVTLRYRFPNVTVADKPDDIVLTYTAPTLITRVPVEFSINDIPIDQ